jgi:hypothetical protein
MALNAFVAMRAIGEAQARSCHLDATSGGRAGNSDSNAELTLAR